jgi:hypothetical protein
VHSAGNGEADSRRAGRSIGGIICRNRRQNHLIGRTRQAGGRDQGRVPDSELRCGNFFGKNDWQ